MNQLKTDTLLSQSGVVANNRMNRERNLKGINSYEKEMGFDPLLFLEVKSQNNQEIRWLDLCCGRGKALIQAAEYLKNNENVYLEGLDLVGMFDPLPDHYPRLSLKEVDLHRWEPEQEYDLITVIHGLHYLGNKLEALRKATSILKPGGLFWANLDLSNIQINHPKEKNPQFLRKWFAEKGFQYQKKKCVLQCSNPLHFQPEWTYLGADDQAGPNYTGQEAVNSYYYWSKN